MVSGVVRWSSGGVCVLCGERECVCIRRVVEDTC